MNNRLFIALPLAAMLALPALAQSTSSTSDQTQPAAAQQTQSTSSDNSSASGKAPLAAPSREGFWGRVNPFARKKYVQRQTEPIRDRVNELDELTSSNSKPISTRSMLATGLPPLSRAPSWSQPASRPLRPWLATSTNTRLRTRPKSVSAPARPF